MLRSYYYLFLIVVYIGTGVNSYYYREEGEICAKYNGARGTCIHFSRCKSAIREVERNGRPEICSFDGIWPIVCCANKDEPDYSTEYNPKYTPKPHPRPLQNSDKVADTQSEDIYIQMNPFDENSISLKKCREYHVTSAHVRPGDPKIKYYPHLAILGVQIKDGIEWKCEGSLISEQYILTSAACVDEKNYGKLKYVKLMGLSSSGLPDVSDPQDFTVKEVYLHPNYKFPVRYHNIAVVRLDRSVRFSDFVRPACIGILKDLKGTYPEASGWGLYRKPLKTQKNPENLLHTDYLAYLPSENCSRIYGYAPEFPKGVPDHLLICADGGPDRRNTCKADPGAPLQIRNQFYKFNTFPEIIGVETDCGTNTGIYTRVYQYMNWIESIVWP